MELAAWSLLLVFIDYMHEIQWVHTGIIVLPCGAGKSLVGVAASSRIKKSVLCLVTNSVSVDQWKHQFKLWTGLQDHQVSRSTHCTLGHSAAYRNSISCSTCL